MSRTLLLPLVLLACTERPLDTASDTQGTSITNPGTTGTATSGPRTTSGQPTTAGVTSDPGPLTTVTSDPGTTDPGATMAIPKQDVPIDMPVAPGLTGCTLAGQPGTDVSGLTGLGEFVADRAYFGAVRIYDPYAPILLLVSPGADPAQEVMEQSGNSGPILHGDILTEGFIEHGWVGTWPFLGAVLNGGNGTGADGLTVTIAAREGNWDVPDPNDPPRLIGKLDGPIAGKFVAVYCDKLDIHVIVE